MPLAIHFAVYIFQEDVTLGLDLAFELRTAYTQWKRKDNGDEVEKEWKENRTRKKLTQDLRINRERSIASINGEYQGRSISWNK